jgi:carboxyl-terminal processing protease
MKRLIIYIFLLALSAGSLSGQRRGKASDTDAAAELQLAKFEQFYQYFIRSYVDTVNYAKLTETAIKETLSQLDPHSTYVSAEEMKEVTESFDGSFSGIGIEFNIIRDTLFVVNTIVGGPAEMVGMQPNDRIVKVDGKSIIGIKQNAVAKQLRGPKGSAVNLNVVRHGVADTLIFRIVRDNIPIKAIDAAYRVDDKTVYIKVNRFAHNTMPEFYEAVIALDKSGDMDNFILDLRGNGGGILEAALEMSNFFLPKGSLLMSAEGENMPQQKYDARNKGTFTKGHVAVLIDEFSASASEIVSGALQDWDRAVIIGRRSFGKGLVQRQFPLIDGSAVRITVARYHTPTGRAIQRPFKQGDKEGYYEALAERINSGTDSIRGDAAEKYTTLRLKKTVYGGGGIYPDFYIAADTTGYSDYMSQLIRIGAVNEYVSLYLDNHRKELEAKYTTRESYEQKFAVGDKMLDELCAVGEKRGVKLDKEGLNTSRGILTVQLKALIAQRLWDTTEYYRITNPQFNDSYKKALDIFKNWNVEAAGIAL